MAYVKIIYQDSPSTATPLNAQNLNHMDDGIAENDRRLNDLAVHNVKSFNGREGDIVSAYGDYDISQVAPTTGATVGQIPIVVNVGTEEEPELQFELDDVPQTGHTIQGADGTNLAQEPTMQFADLHTSDDSVHLKTVIQAVKAVVQADYSSETEDGIYLVKDGDGAVIEPASDDYVEVTADGVKTWRQLYNSLYSLIDTTKLSIFSKIEQSNQIFTFINSDTSNLIFIRSTVSQNTYGNKRLFNAQIKLNSSTSVLETLELYENNTNNYDDRSTDQPSNGTKITLYYGNKKATVDLQTTANRCLMTDGRTVQNATVVDISDKFSVSNNKLRVSAQKNGKRVTLSVSGYDGTFNNAEYVIINDTSLYPNVSAGTHLGGGIGASNGTFIYTTGYFTSNIIIIYHSQDIQVTISQFNVTYDIA